LFRQPGPGNHADVIERLRGELAARIAAWSPARPAD